MLDSSPFFHLEFETTKFFKHDRNLLAADRRLPRAYEFCRFLAPDYQGFSDAIICGSRNPFAIPPHGTLIIGALDALILAGTS